MKKNKVPLFKSLSLISFLPQAIILILIYELLKELHINNYTILSISVYILLSIYLKIIIPRSHRRGFIFIKKNDFEAALICFHRSYSFFNRFLWIDKYRSFFLLSVSKLSYSEMALANMGFCYLRLDKKDEAIKIYKRLLNEYPKNEQARLALNELQHK